MANSDYKQTGNGQFAPLALVTAQVDYLDTTISLGGYSLPNSTSLDNPMAAMIDDEIIMVTGYGPGTITVKRGCADTVPAQHAVNAICWFLGTTVGYDGVAYSGGETIAVKQTPATIGGGSLPVASAPPDDVTMNWRYFRPYAPGLLMAKGTHWFVPTREITSSDPNLTVTWTDRDRIIEADQLVDHTYGNIGPEPGTTYTARVYDSNQQLVRTEVGIIGYYDTATPPNRINSYTYTWTQAMADMGFTGDTSAGDLINATMHFCSNRDNFDSWQDYTIPFTLDTTGQFMRVAQVMQMSVQPESFADTGPTNAVMGAQVMSMAAQAPSTESADVGATAEGIYVAGVQSNAGQATSFYTPLQRNLFEAPYVWLARRNGSPNESEWLVTVCARPSDRLTDAHIIKTRTQAGGDVQPFVQADAPTFTPWLTIDVALQYLETTALIRTSSFFDGIPISSVKIGSLALIDAEIVRVDAIAADQKSITLGRGCCDTVPAKHQANSRLWFFEQASGFDPTDYPWIPKPVPGAAGVDVKMVPTVYGPPLADNEVPTDRLSMARRTPRPYPPGQVIVNGRPWFEGAQASPSSSIFISWVFRDRISQAANVIDHTMADQGGENLQQHRLRMTVSVPSKVAGSAPSTVVIRDAIVDGTTFEYTYEFAQVDGNKVGRLLGACGFVSCDLVLTAIREDSNAGTVGAGCTSWIAADKTKKFGYESWQGYSILLRLPSFACPPGQTPGGGQQGNGLPNGGNGSPGSSTPGNPGSGDNTGAGSDPIDNGGGAPNGDGPPAPPTPPPDWPDPVDPTPQPPTEQNPELAAHWDTNWDRHWDAYAADDIGGNS